MNGTHVDFVHRAIVDVAGRGDASRSSAVVLLLVSDEVLGASDDSVGLDTFDGL